MVALDVFGYMLRQLNFALSADFELCAGRRWNRACATRSCRFYR